MKQKPTSHRRTVGLLLAATALPLTPVSAQDVTTAPAQPSLGSACVATDAFATAFHG